MKSGRFTLRSPAFEEGNAIPSKYAHRGVTGGQNISVPVQWENAPEGARSFALACVDLHPIANNWVHWLLVNIPGDIREVREGVSGTGSLPAGCKELVNSFGEVGYGGPQPPKGSGRHFYQFTVYALDVETLEFTARMSLSTFLRVIEPKVLQRAELTGFYER